MKINKKIWNVIIKWCLHITQCKKLEYRVSNSILYQFESWYIINIYVTLKNIKKLLYILKKQKNHKIFYKTVKTYSFIKIQKKWWHNNFLIKNKCSKKALKLFFIKKKRWLLLNKFNPYLLSLLLKKKIINIKYKIDIHKPNKPFVSRRKRKQRYWKYKAKKKAVLIVSNNIYQLKVFNSYLSKFASKILLYNKTKDGSFLQYEYERPDIVLFFNSIQNDRIKKILFKKNLLIFSIDDIHENYENSSYLLIFDVIKLKHITLLLFNLIYYSFKIRKNDTSKN